MALAPIVLFAYNRPVHTSKTLEALMLNDLANQSDLFVFCDGPKVDADIETTAQIEQVREVVKSKDWCKTVTVYESKINKGLAASIVEGVTEIINRYGKIIVLEDDIITAKGFLRYMNSALDVYAQESEVMHIGSYIPYTNTCLPLPETFFSRFMSCWGWGTWERAWNKAKWDANYLYQRIKTPRILYEFNLEGVLDFHKQLERNIDGSLKTWAIKWFTSIFLQKGLCLYPGVSLTENIGLDGSGENCDIQEESANFDDNRYVNVIHQKPKESKAGKIYLKRFYSYGRDSSLKKRLKNKYVKIRYQCIMLLRVCLKI